MTQGHKISQADRQKMVDAYKSGLSATLSAKRYRYSVSSCLVALKEAGVPLRTHSEATRKHKVNEAFFDKIDNELKAYWLGFLSADGSVRGFELQLGLKMSDINHVYKFKEAIEAEHPVYNTKFGAAEIRINSMRITAALLRLGVGERKSFTIRPCPDVPEHLLRHYWRGLIDGDGSVIFMGKIPQWTLYLCGSQAIVEGFKQYASQFVQSRATARPHRNIFEITYGGNKMAATLLEILYGDATVYLDRKYESAKKACGGFDNETKPNESAIYRQTRLL